MRFPPAPFESGRSRAGFSIIELLAVMAVMSLVVGLTISGANLWKSQQLSASGNQIADLMSMARQNSLTKNTSTAIVIKTRNDGAYAAICLMELSRSSDGTTGDWQMLSPWSFLKDGVVFSPESASTFLSSGSLPSGFPSQIVCRGQSVNMTSGAAVQVYQPDGTLAAGQTVRLRMIEGTANQAGTVVSTHAGSSSANPANIYDIVFLRDTGQTKIERL